MIDVDFAREQFHKWLGYTPIRYANSQYHSDTITKMWRAFFAGWSISK